MKKYLALFSALVMLGLAVACAKPEPYNPDLPDPKQQQKDAKEMWKDVEE